MMWLIAKKDFLLNLLSVRFVIGFVLCLVVIPFTMIVSIDDYNNQMRIYHIDVTEAEGQLKDANVYSAVRPTVIREPEALGAFSKGISANVGNKVKIQMNEYPLFPSGHSVSRDNPLLNAFFSLDFTTVIAITISLLALVFAYDSITRERENGTMKLILTGKISRIAFVMGKFLGLLLTLMPILIFCYLLACVIVLADPGMHLTATDWQGIFLLLLTSMVYMIVFILLGMFISARTSHSSSSIIICLLCWITFLFLIPNIATYASGSISKLPLYDNLQTAIYEQHKEFVKKRGEKKKEFIKQTGGVGEWYYNHNGDPVWQDNFEELSGGPHEMTRWTHLLTQWSMPERLSNADRIWTLQKDYLDRLTRQHQIRQYLAWLSPSELFIQSADILCRTDADAFLDFMGSVRTYRETFLRYFNDKDVYSSYLWFTQMPEEEFPSMEDYRNNNFKYDRSGFLQIDISDMPRYENRHSTSLDTLQSALGRLAALLFLSILLLAGTLAVFMKYDVR